MISLNRRKHFKCLLEAQLHDAYVKGDLDKADFVLHEMAMNFGD